jgi:hypothetical protein
LGWVGLGWVGLGWVGLGWVGLGWYYGYKVLITSQHINKGTTMTVPTLQCTRCVD